MMSAPKRDKRSLLDGVSWADVKEDVKRQEVDAKEQEERIKEAQRLLEERAAVIPLPEPLEVTKKEFEEFFNLLRIRITNPLNKFPNRNSRGITVRISKQQTGDRCGTHNLVIYKLLSFLIWD